MSVSEAVIQGEAIESENESDVEFDGQIKQFKTQYGLEASEGGTVFSGEAPESDDEILAFSSVKLGTAHELTEVYRPSPTGKSHRHTTADISVLQKLLVDRNHSFWNHLNQMVQSTVVTASSRILAAEELLVQSQLKLQAASKSIKEANETADQVFAMCQDIINDKFLPDINIPT